VKTPQQRELALSAPTEPEDILMTRAEAARYLRRTERTLERWAAEGEGPRVVRMGPGHAIRYRLSDLRAFVEASAKQPA
jgi:excisionase family DNA binding protein